MESAFRHAFGQVEELRYDHLQWGDVEARLVAQVLASGAAPQLLKLDLGSNCIGDYAIEELAEALLKTEQLTTLHLHLNRLTDRGFGTLASLLDKGGLPALRVLLVWGNRAGDAGRAALQKAQQNRVASNSLRNDNPSIAIELTLGL